MQWVTKAVGIVKAMWHSNLQNWDAIPEVAGLRFGTYQAGCLPVTDSSMPAFALVGRLGALGAPQRRRCSVAHVAKQETTSCWFEI